jgi:haloacetate dehalogenase
MLAPMLTGFESHTVRRDGVALHTRIGGKGPPLLLLHGHPQTMTMWHRVAPELAERFTLVMMDLRGYGDSQRPTPDASHAAHSKREMALDAVAVMAYHGFHRFDVLAHDRGARVGHRLGVDHPGVVRRALLLDIAPTLAMYQQTGEAFARAYWHWFFLIQPPPLPEMLIDAGPARYVRSVMGSRHAGLAAFDPGALAEYERCAGLPGTAASICEDYRASATIDLEHDRADVAAGRMFTAPLRVLWGEHGTVARCFDVISLWRERASRVTGDSLPCGHYIAEEVPERLIAEAVSFFQPRSEEPS